MSYDDDLELRNYVINKSGHYEIKKLDLVKRICNVNKHMDQTSNS